MTFLPKTRQAWFVTAHLALSAAFAAGALVLAHRPF